MKIPSTTDYIYAEYVYKSPHSSEIEKMQAKRIMNKYKNNEQINSTYIDVNSRVYLRIKQQFDSE